MISADCKKILVASFQSLNGTTGAGMARFGYLISEQLHERGRLKHFIVSSKGKFTTEFPSRPVSWLSRYYLYLLRLLNRFVKHRPYKSRYLEERLYDYFCQQHLDRSVAALIVTTPFLYNTFRKAKRLSIPIFLVPGNPDDNFIYQRVVEENKRFGIEHSDVYTYGSRLAFYNKSLPLIDHFLVFTSIMCDTYQQSVGVEKVTLIPAVFKPQGEANNIDHSTRQTFKVGYIAYTVMLKGLQYLLEAWKSLQNSGMELYIAGSIDESVRQLIHARYSDLENVFYVGITNDVAGFFADKSLCIVPSLIDGYPVTAIEALSNAVPVILTEGCGSKDFIKQEKVGWVVPIRDAIALKEKILEARDQRAETQKRGQRGKQFIETYSLDPVIRTIVDKVLHQV